MPRRPWEATTTAMMVLEGRQGKPVAEVCHAHQIRQAPYAHWRDQGLAQAPQACDVHEPSRREARLAREHTRLNTRVGALTLA